MRLFPISIFFHPFSCAWKAIKIPQTNKEKDWGGKEGKWALFLFLTWVKLYWCYSSPKRSCFVADAREELLNMKITNNTFFQITASYSTACHPRRHQTHTEFNVKLAITFILLPSFTLVKDSLSWGMTMFLSWACLITFLPNLNLFLMTFRAINLEFSL